MKRLFAKALMAASVLVLVASVVLAAAAVDLNTASQKDLEALKGVGPATAKKIIAARPYASVNGLSKAGLSAKLIADLKPLVTVSAPAAASTTAPAKSTATPPSVAKAAPKAATPPAGPVDINTASQKDLEALKGVGPATATKIIAGRPYPSVDALSKAGLSAKLIAELKPNVVASTPAPAPAPAPKTTSTTKVAPMPATPAPKTTSPVTPSTPPATATGPAASSPSTSKAAATKLAPGQTVNINTASKEQLDALPEIGPVKAQAIIDGRPYAKIEDIMKVKGIKQGTFDKIKNLITVH